MKKRKYQHPEADVLQLETPQSCLVSSATNEKVQVLNTYDNDDFVCFLTEKGSTL